MFSGASPLQFRAGIDAGSRQMGNRAFLHWVGELHAAGWGRETHEAAVQGSQAPDRPQTRLAPLQLMPKKKKKTGEPAGAEAADTLPEATPETAVATVPEPQDTVPQTEPGVAVTPGEKKKKKKPRVQVALNALRTDGVEVFGHYIHAEIGEPALLHTLTERITRAQDLGVRQEAALRTVEERMRRLDPEHAVPAVPQAAVARPRQVVEKAVVAPKRTVLSHREEEFFRYVCRGDAGRLRRLLKLVKIDVNMADDYGVTPLCYAVNEGHTAVVRELLSILGIDVNLGEYGRTTPLYIAVQEGRLVIMELLSAVNGINVNLAGADGTTALS